ncbi:MAG: hypothetical protein RSB34_09080, partial [Muribaculaceae bacterium]
KFQNWRSEVERLRRSRSTTRKQPFCEFCVRNATPPIQTKHLWAKVHTRVAERRRRSTSERKF